MPITTIINSLEPSQIAAAVFLATVLWAGAAWIFVSIVHGGQKFHRLERHALAKGNARRAAREAEALMEQAEAEAPAEKELASA